MMAPLHKCHIAESRIDPFWILLSINMNLGEQEEFYIIPSAILCKHFCHIFSL